MGRSALAEAGPRQGRVGSTTPAAWITGRRSRIVPAPDRRGPVASAPASPAGYQRRCCTTGSPCRSLYVR